MNILTKIVEMFRQLFNNSAFMVLVGVIIGGLITGIFNYKTQETILLAQRQQFKDSYLIDKNNQLKKDISNFSELLSKVVFETNVKNKDSIFSSMLSTSLKISLLEDYNIGNKCFDLTTSLKKTYDSLKQIDNNFEQKIIDWIVAVKLEMKTVDYSIDANRLEKDLLQLIINNPEKK